MEDMIRYFFIMKIYITEVMCTDYKLHNYYALQLNLNHL